MWMGSYFVEIYATKILSVFLYIPHHRTSGFWKCLSRHVWAENPLFFQGKKLLPDVGIFRKISRIRKQPGFDVLFLLCLCVCVFFSVCVFFCARARNFLGPDRALNKKKSVPTLIAIGKKKRGVCIWGRPTLLELHPVEIICPSTLLRRYAKTLYMKRSRRC